LEEVDPGTWQGSELVLILFSNIPNRSTFVCPYCGARNLDQQELVKHCMENHRNDPNKVVSKAGMVLGWVTAGNMNGFVASWAASTQSSPCWLC